MLAGKKAPTASKQEKVNYCEQSCSHHRPKQFRPINWRSSMLHKTAQQLIWHSYSVWGLTQKKEFNKVKNF